MNHVEVSTCSRKNYVGSIEAKEESVDVELVDNIICDLKPGKACGIDNLMGEHLQVILYYVRSYQKCSNFV